MAVKGATLVCARALAPTLPSLRYSSYSDLPDAISGIPERALVEQGHRLWACLVDITFNSDSRPRSQANRKALTEPIHADAKGSNVLRHVNLHLDHLESILQEVDDGEAGEAARAH